mmetsp:Transcript_943/g.1453  ORF Transcript_943/g.1453 Transcript_943/m.1453 type:complete len:84 (-) Transcript_943:1221-1472(-)
MGQPGADVVAWGAQHWPQLFGEQLLTPEPEGGGQGQLVQFFFPGLPVPEAYPDQGPAARGSHGGLTVCCTSPPATVRMSMLAL